MVAADPGTKLKTVIFYRYITNIHLLPAIGDIGLDKLTPVHVRAMINDKRRCISEKTGKLLSGRTVKGIQRTLHTALEFAVGEDFINRNPAGKKKRKSSGEHSADPSSAKFLQLNEARPYSPAPRRSPYITRFSWRF